MGNSLVFPETGLKWHNLLLSFLLSCTVIIRGKKELNVKVAEETKKQFLNLYNFGSEDIVLATFK